MAAIFCDRRTFLGLSAAALSTIGIAGCSNRKSSADRPITMTDDFRFDPKTKTIETGQTVTWTNTSDVDHTVTAYGDDIPDSATYFASGGFESERDARNRVSEGLVAPGSEYEHTFGHSGRYEYYCVPHESSGMTGTIQVE